MQKCIACMLGVLWLAACSSSDGGWLAPAQSWQDMRVHVETRPVQVRTGMNEFLVIVDRKQRGFSSDLMVKVRTEYTGWKQAMPDGALGIYRRALPVKDVRHDHLFVEIHRQHEKTSMIFDLAPE